MAITQEPTRVGIRVTSAIVSLVANTTPLTLLTLGGANRTAVLRKIHMFNHGGGDTEVQFGTGTAPFVQGDLPGFRVVAGFDRQVIEDSLLNWETAGPVTCQATVAAAAPANVQVSVEAEVFMGT